MVYYERRGLRRAVQCLAAQKCEAMTAEVHSAIAFMRDTAASYREEAKKIFKRIEECSIFTEEVRKTCETLKLRMIGGK